MFQEADAGRDLGVSKVEAEVELKFAFRRGRENPNLKERRARHNGECACICPRMPERLSSLKAHIRNKLPAGNMQLKSTSSEHSILFTSCCQKVATVTALAGLTWLSMELVSKRMSELGIR